MKNVWFTSDFHLNHHNIIKYDNRPFSSVEEMNYVILKNFNSKVKDKDDVYYIGDFSFSIEVGVDFLKHANGNWTFLLGNHDQKLKRILSQVKEENGKNYKVHKKLFVEINNIKFLLYHYPLEKWEEQEKRILVFGHTHNPDMKKVGGKRKNVCINLTNYFPVSFEKIIE